MAQLTGAGDSAEGSTTSNGSVTEIAEEELTEVPLERREYYFLFNDHQHHLLSLFFSFITLAASRWDATFDVLV